MRELNALVRVHNLPWFANILLHDYPIIYGPTNLNKLMKAQASIEKKIKRLSQRLEKNRAIT